MLRNEKPDVPVDKMRVQVNVIPDKENRDVLTLKLVNDKLHRVDKYRRMP
jgi:hypothetical protein